MKTFQYLINGIDLIKSCNWIDVNKFSFLFQLPRDFVLTLYIIFNSLVKPIFKGTLLEQVPTGWAQSPWATKFININSIKWFNQINTIN